MDLLRCLHRRFISPKLNRLIKRRISKPVEDEELGDSSSSSPWDRLPDLAVDKIFSNLCVADRVRMQSVCKSWKSILRRRDLPHAPEAPWLIVPEEDHDICSEIRLKSMRENRIYRFILPRLAWRKRRRGGELGYWCCCGSSNGWLLIAVGRDLRDVKMILWNPLSGEIMNLPSLSSLWFFDRLMEEGDRSMLAMVRCMRVSLPDDADGCMVVAIVLAKPYFTEDGGGRWEHLVMCTPHDLAWKTVGGEKPCEFYRDLCFHKGNLYALCSGHDVLISKYDVSFTRSNCDVVLLLLDLPLIEEEDVEYLRPAGVKVWEQFSTSHYLMECWITGELLLVTAVTDLYSYKATNQYDPIGNFCCTQTSRFAVYRLIVTDNNRLEEMNDGVGEQGVFVGQMGSVSLKDGVAADRVSFATRHADFWMDPIREGDEEEEDEVEQVIDEERLFDVLEQGVYDLRQGRIETKSRIIVPCSSGSAIGWFTPKLF